MLAYEKKIAEIVSKIWKGVRTLEIRIKNKELFKSTDSPKP